MQTVRRLDEWGFLRGEGRAYVMPRQGEDMHMLGNPKTPSRQVQIYLVLVSLCSVLPLRHASLPVLPLFFFFEIYTQRCCVTLVLLGE